MTLCSHDYINYPTYGIYILDQNFTSMSQHNGITYMTWLDPNSPYMTKFYNDLQHGYFYEPLHEEKYMTLITKNRNLINEATTLW